MRILLACGALAFAAGAFTMFYGLSDRGLYRDWPDYAVWLFPLGFAMMLLGLLGLSA